MANKFGKVLLLTAVAAATGVAAYYFLQKKDYALTTDDSDEDFDDFSDNLEDKDTSSRTYVPLNHDNVSENDKEASSKTDDSFTPLSEKVAQAGETVKNKAEETVEEFFDEENPTADSSDSKK